MIVQCSNAALAGWLEAVMQQNVHCILSLPHHFSFTLSFLDSLSSLHTLSTSILHLLLLTHHTSQPFFLLPPVSFHLFLPALVLTSFPMYSKSGWMYLLKNSGNAVIRHSDTHTHTHWFYHSAGNPPKAHIKPFLYTEDYFSIQKLTARACSLYHVLL